MIWWGWVVTFALQALAIFFFLGGEFRLSATASIAVLVAVEIAAFTQAAVIRTLRESNEERTRLLDDAHNMAERSINGVSTYLWKSGETLALIRDVLDDHGAAAARDLMTVQIEYIRQNIKPPNWTENVEDIVKNLEEQ